MLRGLHIFMFELYTEKARRVIFFARVEASQFGSSYIETEHLLLGLLREDKALANRFLPSHRPGNTSTPSGARCTSHKAFTHNASTGGDRRAAHDASDRSPRGLRYPTKPRLRPRG